MDSQRSELRASGGPAFVPPLSGEGQDSVQRVAVVDIGSNSVRLVVYETGTGLPSVLYNEKVHCGLGRGLSETGALNREGMQKALASLERFVALSRAMGVSFLELVATAAVRDAQDGADFADIVEQSFALPVRVLSGEEEARLSALGVMWGAPSARGLIGDLGGGSLELISVKKGQILQQVTLPLGPLRLMATVGEEAKAARSVIEAEVERLDWLDLEGNADFYAVGGAWRALAKVQMALSDYPLSVIHGYSQSRRAIRSVAGLVAQQTGRSLAGFADLGAARRETLPLASLVMSGVLSAARPKNVIFSGFGLREGWLYERQADILSDKDPLIAVAQDCAQRIGRFGDRGDALFNWIAPLFPKRGRKQARLRKAVCHFIDIAWREHPEYRATYALERILKWPGLAANHKERAFIAHSLYVRYGGSGVAPVVKTLLRADRQYQAQVLGLALRLAHTLSVGGATTLDRAKLTLKDGTLDLEQTAGHSLASGDVVERRMGHLRKVIADHVDDFSLHYDS